MAPTPDCAPRTRRSPARGRKHQRIDAITLGKPVEYLQRYLRQEAVKLLAMRPRRFEGRDLLLFDWGAAGDNASMMRQSAMTPRPHWWMIVLSSRRIALRSAIFRSTSVKCWRAI